MKKLLLFFSLFSFSIAQAQILTDTGQIRSYVNANIVTNGTKAITAVSLNRILNGYLNAWPSSGINTINATGPLSWNAGTKTLSITGYNAANWNTVYNWYVAGGGGGSSVTGTKSINISSGVAQLQNDILSPGPGKVYGTDASGIRGWYLPPAPSLSGTKSINYSAGIIQLVNDATSPGNTKIYGTDASGIKGWYDAPTGGAATTLATNRIAGRISAGTGVIEPIAPGKNVTISSGQLDAIDVTYSAKNLGFAFTGDESTLLQAKLNGSTNEILFDAGNITVSSGTHINAHGKTISFANGAMIKGSGYLDSVKIKADDRAVIFDSTLHVTGYNDRVSIMWWNAKADYDYNGYAGRDNYSSFMKAYNFFPTNKAKYIFIPQPDVQIADDNLGYFYRFSTNPGLLSASNLHIVGEGKQSALLLDGTKLGIQLTGQKSTIEHLRLLGRQGQVSGGYNSNSAHGVWLAGNNTKAIDVFVQNFDGDGFVAAGDVTLGTNANNFRIVDCHAVGNGNANFATSGGDANQGTIMNPIAEAGGRYNYHLLDFLGSTLINPQSQAAANGHNYNKTVVTYGGHTWNAIADNINVTPGTDATVWAQTTFDSYFGGAWSSTTQYYSGAAYFLEGATNRSAVQTPYYEGDEYAIIQASTMIVFGGNLWESGIKFNGNLYNKLGTLTTDGSFGVNSKTNDYYARLNSDIIGQAGLVLGGINGELAYMQTDVNDWSYVFNNSGTSANIHIKGFTVGSTPRTKMRFDGGIDLGTDSYSNTYSSVGVASSAPSNSFGSDGDIRFNTGSDTSLILWKKIAGAWFAQKKGGGGGGVGGSAAGSSGQIQFNTSGAFDASANLTFNGGLGINTNSSGAAIHAKESSSTPYAVKFENRNGLQVWSFNVDGNAVDDGQFAVIDVSNGTIPLRILPGSGNVGINVGNPSHKLEVNGTLGAGASDITTLNLSTTPATSTGSYDLLSRNSSTGAVEKASILSNTTNALSSNFTATGDAWNDVTTFSLSAGTYLLNSSTTVFQNTSASSAPVTFRLYDATNSVVIASGSLSLLGNDYATLSLSNPFVASGTTTIKIQVYPTDDTNLQVRAFSYKSDANASVLSAIKIQ